jgi:hypothetical protein
MQRMTKVYVRTMHFGRLGALALGAVLATMVGTSVSAWAHSQPELSPEMEAIRAHLEKYQDPIVAIRDGYFSTLACVAYPDGDMGVHFLNPALIGPAPDPMAPPILMYEPSKGKLRLAGVEWFIPLATGVEGHPELFGQPFEGPMEGHEPLIPKDLHHYDLHAWLYLENPNGLLHHSNPEVKCDGNWPYVVVEEPPPEVPRQ